MEAVALAVGVASAASVLETSLDNARHAQTATDLTAALDSADSALANIKELTRLAFDQASKEPDA